MQKLVVNISRGRPEQLPVSQPVVERVENNDADTLDLTPVQAAFQRPAPQYPSESGRQLSDEITALPFMNDVIVNMIEAGASEEMVRDMSGVHTLLDAKGSLREPDTGGTRIKTPESGEETMLWSAPAESAAPVEPVAPASRFGGLLTDYDEKLRIAQGGN